MRKETHAASLTWLLPEDQSSLNAGLHFLSQMLNVGLWVHTGNCERAADGIVPQRPSECPLVDEVSCGIKEETQTAEAELPAGL